MWIHLLLRVFENGTVDSSGLSSEVFLRAKLSEAQSEFLKRWFSLSLKEIAYAQENDGQKQHIWTSDFLNR